MCCYFHGVREHPYAGWRHHLPGRGTFHSQSDTAEHLTWVTFTMLYEPLSHTSTPFKGLRHVCKKVFEYFLHSSASHHFMRFVFKKPLFSSLSDLVQRLWLTVITGTWYLLVKLCLQEYCQCLLSWHLMSCLRGYLKMLMWTEVELTDQCKIL